MNPQNRRIAQSAIDRLVKQKRESELIEALLKCAFVSGDKIEHEGNTWCVDSVFISRYVPYIRLRGKEATLVVGAAKLMGVDNTNS